MPTAIEFIADRLPRVTVEDVRRFADTVEIRDAPAFAAELQAFIHERVEAVKLPANLEGETVEHALKRKTAALRAETRWAPTETDVQRGRAVLLETFNQPHNLPPAEYAKLADKSRQQIYKRHPRPSAAGAERGAARPETARLAARPGEAAVDPNRASGGRGHRPLDDLPRTVRTARRLWAAARQWMR